MSSEVQQKKRIVVPQDLDSTDRLKVGRSVIQRILERTASNIGADGKRFKNYSTSYANTLDFKVAGKSIDDPNLRLSGDMLDAGLQLLEHGPGYITVGFEPGTKENDKAAWAAASDNGPSRRFLGISDNDLELIIAEVRTELPQSVAELSRDEVVQKRVAQATAKQVTKNILNYLGFDDGQN